MTVMVVEDYEPLRVLCARLLRNAGYTSISAPSADDALAMLADGVRPAVVVTDLNMPGHVSGEEFVEHLRAEHPDVGLVVVTGAVSSDSLSGGTGEIVLTKPFANDSLLDAVDAVKV